MQCRTNGWFRFGKKRSLLGVFSHDNNEPVPFFIFFQFCHCPRSVGLAIIGRQGMLYKGK